jgi:hypothetical protein
MIFGNQRGHGDASQSPSTSGGGKLGRERPRRGLEACPVPLPSPGPDRKPEHSVRTVTGTGNVLARTQKLT